MSHRVRGLVVVLVVLLAGVAVMASGDDNKAEKVGGGGSDAAAPTAFGVGDEVKLETGPSRFGASRIRRHQQMNSLKPKDGFRWVTLDSEVKNLSTDPEIVSSILCFHVQDSANREYNVHIVSGVTPGPPDGEVAGERAEAGERRL